MRLTRDRTYTAQGTRDVHIETRGNEKELKKVFCSQEDTQNKIKIKIIIIIVYI